MKTTHRRPTRRQPSAATKRTWIAIHARNRPVISWPFSSRKWEHADIEDSMVGIQFGRSAA